MDLRVGQKGLLLFSIKSFRGIILVLFDLLFIPSEQSYSIFTLFSPEVVIMTSL